MHNQGGVQGSTVASFYFLLQYLLFQISLYFSNCGRKIKLLFKALEPNWKILSMSYFQFVT